MSTGPQRVIPRRALVEAPSPAAGPDGARRTDTPAPGGNRWLVLATCCLSLFVVGLDVSGLNLALPSIRTGLHVDESRLQWILDAYTLVLASLLMASGSVADRVGRKKVFRIGLALFGLGSMACAFSTSGDMLITFRALQAIGGSMMNPVAMSIITNTFDDPRERAQAIGLWGATSGIAMALGPVIGGALVESFDWQAIFWVNVPVVVVALVLTSLVVPESRAPHPRSLDPRGQVLALVALASLTYAIIEGRTAGWGSARILGCFGLALVAVVAFGLVEQKVAEPMVDPVFFSSIPFSGANVMAVVGFAAMAGFLFINTLYLQGTRGMSPVHAGLMTLPMALVGAVCAPLSGRVTGGRGPRWPLVLSGLGTLASGVLLARITPTTPVAELLVGYALFGFGYGLMNAPISNTAVSGMPRARAGVAASIASTSRQMGSALGVALFGTLTFSQVGPDTDFAAASHVSWWVIAGTGVVAVLIGMLVQSPVALRSRERVGRSFDLDS